MLRWKHILGVSVTAIATLATFSCSSDDDDDDNGAAAGTGGGFGVTGGSGGNAGTAGSGETGGSGGTTEGPQACETLVGLGECGVQTVAATKNVVNMLLVIDKSSSMVNNKVQGDITRWDAMKQALSTALPKVQDRISIGLEVFPKEGLPTSCTDVGPCCETLSGEAAINVPIAQGSLAVPQVLDKLNTINAGGGTPTSAALAAAREYFTTGAGKDLPGDKYVVLATDGGPNCLSADTVCTLDRCTANIDGRCEQPPPPAAPVNCCETLTDGGLFCLGDQAVISEIESLKTAGVSTFVIGIPGTEQYAGYLDSFAEAGGVPNLAGPKKYYAVSAESGVEGLTKVFEDITTSLVRSCEVELASKPFNEKMINVAVECQIIPKTAEDGSGWTYDPNAEPQKVELQGPICQYIQTQGVRQVDVVVGCPTVGIE